MLRVNKTTGIALVTIIVLFLLASGTHRSDFHFKSFPGAHDAASSTSTSRPRPSLVGAPTLLYPQPGGQTYPRAIKLRSGTLLATLTVQDENLNQAIQMVISHDQGLTWSPHSVVISKPATDATPVDNGFLLEMPSGRILCAFRSHTKVAELLNAEEKPGGQNEGYLYYRLIIHYSDDGGKTWEFLSTPTHEAGPAHGNWEPGLRLTNSGELQFFYSRELGGGRDQDNLIRISEDEGVSWSNATNVSGQDLVTRDGMMGIVEITPGSGHLMAVFETVQEKEDVVVFTARFEIWSVQSRDDGKTWGERKMIYAGWYGEEGAPDRTKRNAGAPSIILVGKTLVVSFMTDETKLEGMWHRNAYVKIITSHDQGMTWGDKTIVADAPAAWAGMLTLNSTDFLLLCEHHDRVKAQRVTLS